MPGIGRIGFIKLEFSRVICLECLAGMIGKSFSRQHVENVEICFLFYPENMFDISLGKFAGNVKSYFLQNKKGKKISVG